MRTNPFQDAFLFLIGSTSDHENSGVGWLMTALFLALLAASGWIARRNWLQDPTQRTTQHLATWFMRLMIGAMWYQGSLWKLPLPVSGGFAGWTAALADNAAFEFHRWIARNVFVPLLADHQPGGLPDRAFAWCSLHPGFSRPALRCSRHAVCRAPLARSLSTSRRVALALHIPHFRAGFLRAQQCRKELGPRRTDRAHADGTVCRRRRPGAPLPQDCLRSREPSDRQKLRIVSGTGCARCAATDRLCVQRRLWS